MQICRWNTALRRPRARSSGAWCAASPRRRAPAEAVPDHGEGHQRAEQGRTERGQEADLDAGAEPGSAFEGLQ